MEPAQVARNRRIFLESIREHSPKVLRSLRGFYRILNDRRITNIVKDIDDWGERNRVYNPDSKAGAWLVRAASKTLRYWDAHPELIGPAAEAGTPPPPWSPDAADVDLSAPGNDEVLTRPQRELLMSLRESPFRFDHSPWSPADETRAQYEDHLRGALKDRLDEYCGRFAPFVGEPGGRTRGRKRELERHFRWLALYQFNNLSYSQIASTNEDMAGSDRTTVSAAVRQAAALLFGGEASSWLRPDSKSGRPRSTTRPPTLEVIEGEGEGEE